MPRSTNSPMLIFSIPYVRMDFPGVVCENRLPRRCTANSIRRIEPVTTVAMYRSPYPNLSPANRARTSRRKRTPLLMLTAVTNLNLFYRLGCEDKERECIDSYSVDKHCEAYLQEEGIYSTSTITPTTRKCSRRRNLNAVGTFCLLSSKSFSVSRPVPSGNPK